jgi:hypothetical protein
VSRSVQQGRQHDTFCNEHRQLRFYRHDREQKKNFGPASALSTLEFPQQQQFMTSLCSATARIQALRRYRSVSTLSDMASYLWDKNCLCLILRQVSDE